VFLASHRVPFRYLCACLLLMLGPPIERLAASSDDAQHNQVQWAPEIKRALAGADAPQQILALLTDNRWADAEAELNVLATSGLHDPELATLQGVLSLLQGHLPQAQQSFERALALAPGFEVARRNLAITFWHEHHNGEAVKLLRLFHDKNPDDALGNLYLGQAEFSEHDCSAAVKSFHQAGDLLPSWPAAMFMYAVCDSQLGNRDEAVGLLKRMGTHPHLPPQSVFQFALQAEREGQHLVAFAALRLLPDDYPDPYLHAYDTALAASEAGDYDAAISGLHQLGESGKSTPESLNLLGNALQNAGFAEKKPQLVQEAYNAYRQGIYQDPHYLGNFLDIALLAMKLTDFNLAQQLLTQGVNQNPQAGQLLLERGTAYEFGGQKDLAAADYVRAQQVNPADPLPYAFEGLLKMQHGNYQEAVSALEKGIKQSRKPEVWLYYLLGRALQQSGDTTATAQAQTREALKEAIRLDPHFTDAYGLAGLVYLKSGDYEQAAHFLQMAHRLDPNNSDYVYKLAMAEKLKGDPNSAAKYLKTFQELKAANDPARVREYYMRILVARQSTPASQEAAGSNDR